MTRLPLLLLALALTSSMALAQEPDTEAPVSAEDEARAKELFENGRILYDEGRYADAIEAWKEGYRLSRRPLFHYNIGNAYERLGDLPKAIYHLNRYRAFAPADERTALERRIKSLEERLVAQPGVAPAPEPAPAPAPAPVAATAPEPLPPEPAPAPSPRGPGPATWALGGVTVAALGVGVGFGVSSSSAKGTASEACAEGTSGVYCRVESEPWLTRHRTHAAIADAGFVAAGAAAVATLVVTLVDQRAPALGPLPVRHGFGLQVRGRFR